MLPSVSGVGVLPSADVADWTGVSLPCNCERVEMVDLDELDMESSSMMTPFALQVANCSLVSSLTPRKLVSVKDRAFSKLFRLTLKRIGW